MMVPETPPATMVPETPPLTAYRFLHQVPDSPTTTSPPPLAQVPPAPAAKQPRSSDDTFGEFDALVKAHDAARGTRRATLSTPPNGGVPPVMYGVTDLLDLPSVRQPRSTPPAADPQAPPRRAPRMVPIADLITKITSKMVEILRSVHAREPREKQPVGELIDLLEKLNKLLDSAARAPEGQQLTPFGQSLIANFNLILADAKELRDEVDPEKRVRIVNRMYSKLQMQECVVCGRPKRV
jgi:hypothetical protein